MIVAVDGKKLNRAGRPLRRDQRQERGRPGRAARAARRRGAHGRGRAGRAPGAGAREPLSRLSGCASWSATSRSRCASRCCRCSARTPVAGPPRRRRRGGDVTFAIDAEAERTLEEFLAERAPERGLLLGGPRPGRALRAHGGGGPGGRPDRRHPAGARRARVVLRVGGRGAARRRAGDGRRDASAAWSRSPPARCSWPSAAPGWSRAAPRACPPTSGSTACSGPTASAAGRRGRSAEVLAELIDASSVGGATFDLGSACFDMTRVVTGQLDAYVEPGPRLVADVPGMRAEFERVGGGAVLNNSPYDLAAATLDPGGGRGGRDRRLRRARWPTGRCSARAPSSRCRWWLRANQALQSQILAALDAGIDRLNWVTCRCRWPRFPTAATYR